MRIGSVLQILLRLLIFTVIKEYKSALGCTKKVAYLLEIAIHTFVKRGIEQGFLHE